MEPFFEQRGYSHALLQNDLHAIRQIDRIDVLNNHRPSNQRSDRIPLVLTYHSLNERIKIILIRNLNILTADPETREFFSKLPLVAATATSVISSNQNTALLFIIFLFFFFSF